MNKQRYHVEQGDEGWEVVDSDGIAVNPEPFRQRHEAVRFLNDVKAEAGRQRANDRYWARLESYHEDRYDLGD